MGATRDGTSDTAARAAPIFALLAAAAAGVFGVALTDIGSIYPVAERATLPAHMTLAASNQERAGVPQGALGGVQPMASAVRPATAMAGRLVAGLPLPRPVFVEGVVAPRLGTRVLANNVPSVPPILPRGLSAAGDLPQPGPAATFGLESAPFAVALGPETEPFSLEATAAITARRTATLVPRAAPLLDSLGAIDRAPNGLLSSSLAQPGYALSAVDAVRQADAVPAPPPHTRSALAGTNGAQITPPEPAPAKPTLALAALSPVFKPADRSFFRSSAVPTVAAVTAHFDAIEYDLAEVRVAADPVPRLYLDALPRDLVHLSSTETKKSVFIQTVLPVILRVNEELAKERERVQRLRAELTWRGKIAPDDRAWLDVVAARYDIASLDWDALLRKLDVIPPSLALAQAAEESGWGTSRFAREGNALFGQYTYDSRNGIVPRKRESGRTHRIRAYENLLDTVRAYAYNLNSHAAYDGFRHKRATLRNTGQRIAGYELATGLTRYSERGNAYVRTIRQIIRYNRLGDFDRAQLHNRQWTAIDRVTAQNRS
jgi:Bax protein